MTEPKLTFIEAIRLRPAMYIGSTSIRGFNHLLSEITQYGFEELAARKFVFRILGNWRGEIVFGDFCTPFVDSIVQDWIPKKIATGTLNIMNYLH